MLAKMVRIYAFYFENILNNSKGNIGWHKLSITSKNLLISLSQIKPIFIKILIQKTILITISNINSNINSVRLYTYH
jgi:hypothetical protein